MAREPTIPDMPGRAGKGGRSQPAPAHIKRKGKAAIKAKKQKRQERKTGGAG